MRTDTREMPVHTEQDPPSGDGRRGAIATAAGCSHRGDRDDNQDRMYVGERVFAVADGIGGRSGGGIAAEVALEPLAALDRACADAANVADVAVALRDTAEEANAQVRARRNTNPHLREMGTTLTAVALHGADVHVAQVGDSRLYRLRGDVLEQVTTDHTLVQQLVDQGRLSPAGARNHPHGNVITRAVGARARIRVEMSVVDLAIGDTFLLCSDGLTGALTQDAIAEALGSDVRVSDIAARLVEESVSAGARDNVTAIVVRPAQA